MSIEVHSSSNGLLSLVVGVVFGLLIGLFGGILLGRCSMSISKQIDIQQEVKQVEKEPIKVEDIKEEEPKLTKKDKKVGRIYLVRGVHNSPYVDRCYKNRWGKDLRNEKGCASDFFPQRTILEFIGKAGSIERRIVDDTLGTKAIGILRRAMWGMGYKTLPIVDIRWCCRLKKTLYKKQLYYGNFVKVRVVKWGKGYQDRR